MHNEDTPIKTDSPFYKKWWFLTVILLALMYVTSVAAVSLLQERLHNKQSPAVTVMYKWTDKEGVTHYSDVRPDVTSEEISYISNTTASDTMDNIEINVFMASHKVRPVLGILLTIFIGSVVLIKGISAIRQYTEHRKTHRYEEDFIAILEACVQSAKDFRSILSTADIDKAIYVSRLQDFRKLLEKAMQNQRTHEKEYAKVIEYLKNTFETYVDCLSLWEIKSQRTIIGSKENAFIAKYPKLLDKTTGIDKPLPPEELQQAVRITLWNYASRFIVQAERLLATSKNIKGQSSPDVQETTKNSPDK